MNIIDIQDNLKNFSEKQLINEMQRPSGNAPQFLVLSEITRRKRMRDQFKSDQAAKEQTVAQEAVAAAGVPQGGIMGMSEAMAPKASMAEGGIGSVMSAPMKAPMGAMPMSEGGIMSMSAGGASKPRIEERRMKSGKIGLFQGNTFLGTKQDRDDDGESLASKIGFGGDRDIMGSIRDVLGFEEGGVIKAQNGLPLGLRQNNPGNIRPGAGFIGETGQGGGYSTFASEDEGLRAIQRLLMTYGNQYGLNTIRGLANRYAPKSENPTESYIDFISQKTGIGPDEEIDLAGRGSDLIPAIVGFEQGQQPFSQAQIDRAIRAAGTDDPDMVRQILAEDLAPQEKVTSNFSLMDLLFPKAEAATVKDPPENVDEVNPDKELRSGRRSRRAGTEVLTEADKDVMTVQDILDNKVPTLSDVSGPITNPTQRRIDSASRRMAEDFGDEFGNIPDPEPKPPVIKDFEELSSGQKKQLSRTGNVSGVDIVENKPTSDTDAEEDDKKQSTGLRQTSAEAGPLNTTLANNVNNLILSDSAGAGAGEVTSLEAEIKAMQDKLKKDSETDKYLALAQAGLALMSSKNPRLLGAVGEAGISGLKAMREAQKRYNEGVVDLINARAKLKKKTDSDVFTASNAVTRLNAIDRTLAGIDATIDLDPDRKEKLLNERRVLARFLETRGLPGFATEPPKQQAPAT